MGAYDPNCINKEMCGRLCDDETENENEWSWDASCTLPSISILSEDCKEVTFHPAFSSGTAAIRGDTPFKLNHLYFWEIKVLSVLYGTDVMIGVGTPNVDLNANLNRYSSSLGDDNQSWGLSYTGRIQHNGEYRRYATKFMKDMIVSVRLDTWQGTLEFYVDRVPQGVAFHDMRKHPVLYPMMCSTAAQSTLRLIYAGSCRSTLLTDCIRQLQFGLPESPPLYSRFSTRRKVTSDEIMPWVISILQQYSKKKINNVHIVIPPGLSHLFRRKFFLLMPFGGDPEKIQGYNVIPKARENDLRLLGHCMGMQQRLLTDV